LFFLVVLGCFLVAGEEEKMSALQCGNLLGGNCKENQPKALVFSMVAVEATSINDLALSQCDWWSAAMWK